MKNVFLLTLLALASAGCLSVRMDEALLGPMREAWSSIRADIVIGAVLPVEPEVMDAALKSGDLSDLRAVNWNSLRAAALTGISVRVLEGQISEGVAISLRERVKMFDLAYQRITRVRVVKALRDRPLVISRSSWATSPPPAIAGRVWR